MKYFLLSFFAAISPGPNMFKVINLSINKDVEKNNILKFIFGIIFAVFIWCIVCILFLKTFNNYIFEYRKYFYILQGILFLLIGISIVKNSFSKKTLIFEKEKRLEFNSFYIGFISAILNIEIPIFYNGIFLLLIEENLNPWLYSVFFILIESFVFLNLMFFASFLRTLNDKIIKIINIILAIIIFYFAFQILLHIK